jgi:hypothetical protein
MLSIRLLLLPDTKYIRQAGRADPAQPDGNLTEIIFGRCFISPLVAFCGLFQ